MKRKNECYSVNRLSDPTKFVVVAINNFNQKLYTWTVHNQALTHKMMAENREESVSISNVGGFSRTKMLFHSLS